MSPPYMTGTRLVPLAGVVLKAELVRGRAEGLALTPTLDPAVVIAGAVVALAACRSDDCDPVEWWCTEARAWLVRHGQPVPDGGADVLAAALARAKGAA